jgi:hypothetical protein
MVDKLLAKWMIMKVNAVISHGNSEELINLQGWIAKSNFLHEHRIFEMPVLSKQLSDVNPGDYVRLTFFTRQQGIFSEPGNTLGFMDEGLRYERLDGAGWDLLYEDFPEVT